MVAHMHNGSGRRSRLRNLFAERRVHVRNGHESRYVVLSPTLQAGVAAGALALVALLALTSYNAISGRLDLATRERELAALGADKALAERAADQAQALQQRNAAAEAEIARLTEALAQTQARDDGEASARLAALQTELDTATARNRELAAALAEARAAGQAQTAQAGAAPSAEIEALRAEVIGLRAEIDRLEREAESLRRSAAQAREALGALQAAPAPEEPRAFTILSPT
jgi:chromosome segregation protein